MNPPIHPRLTYHEQYEIAPPFRAYCHVCQTPFLTLDELQKHMKESLNDHRKVTK